MLAFVYKKFKSILIIYLYLSSVLTVKTCLEREKEKNRYDDYIESKGPWEQTNQYLQVVMSISGSIQIASLN